MQSKSGGFVNVSIVIPTLNAGQMLDSLLKKLEEQTILPYEILVVDSSSEDNTVAIAKTHTGVQTSIIPRDMYNHGGTRDSGVRQTRGDIVLFLTQDAVPADNRLIENLLRPFSENPYIAVSYARQIPRQDSSPREKLVRAFNYPEQSEVHSIKDIPRIGIKTFFCSNVCAAYRRDIYDQLGGFEKDLLSNEDMMYAAKAIRNGYQVAYASDAAVVHSHDFCLREQYERNRIQGYEIARHHELLDGASSSKEGLRMLKTVTPELLKKGKIISIFGLLSDCAARYLGSKKGQVQYEKSKEENT